MRTNPACLVGRPLGHLDTSVLSGARTPGEVSSPAPALSPLVASGLDWHPDLGEWGVFLPHFQEDVYLPDLQWGLSATSLGLRTPLAIWS